MDIASRQVETAFSSIPDSFDAGQAAENDPVSFMKKPTVSKTKKPTKLPVRKSSSSKKAKPSPGVDDRDTFFALLGEAIAKDIGLDPDLFEDDSPSDLFVEFLEACKSDEIPDEEKDDLSADLFETLSELRVEANSGDRSAREQIREIYGLLDDELDEKSLALPDIILLGKIFTDAGWEVPEKLKQSAAEALDAFTPSPTDLEAHDAMSSLQEVLGRAQEDPFEAYEFLVSMLASLPTEYGSGHIQELISQGDPALGGALLGFFLYPNDEFFRKVAVGLAQTGHSFTHESQTIERLLRIRPWLPEQRQVLLDSVVKSMRQKALAPVQAKAYKFIKAYASVCDGAGCMTIVASLRIGKVYHICSIMIKDSGVCDVLVLQDMPKAQIDVIVRRLRSSIQTHEIDIGGIRKLLGLAIAENRASGLLPPFRLIQACEMLGIGIIPADKMTYAEICEQLLSDLPAETTDENASKMAHRSILDHEFTEHWFEAGETLENLLYPIKGKLKRIEKVLKSYLPQRRDFWARQCAFSAVALSGEKSSKLAEPVWQQLALVGRDIASDKSLDQIPLMKKIAAITVEAFQSQQ